MWRVIVDLAGVMGGVFGSFAWGPQLWRTWNTKSADDISLGLLLLVLASLTAFLIHGFGLSLWFLVAGVAAQVVLVIPVTILKVRYDPDSVRRGVATARRRLAALRWSR